MRLKTLQLVNFRNYDNLHINFNEKVNLLVGKNGQGKTNIVESIYMLSFGKSFRTSKDREIIKFEKENLYVGGSFSKYNSDYLIEIAIGKNKKGVKVNKVHIQKMYELLGNLNVVIFSPEDLKLVKEGPKERRAFIDKEISQIIPKYYNYLTNYNKVLFQRNKLLKGYIVDKKLLDVYDESLARYGSYIYILRRDFIKKIANISISNFCLVSSNSLKTSSKIKTGYSPTSFFINSISDNFNEIDAVLCWPCDPYNLTSKSFINIFRSSLCIPYLVVLVSISCSLLDTSFSINLLYTVSIVSSSDIFIWFL